MYHIEQLLRVDPTDLANMNELLRQLTGKPGGLDTSDLQDLLQQETTQIWIARTIDSPNSIVAMLSTAVVSIPTGKKAWIEDVVVQKAWRRQGIGRSLMATAVQNAVDQGCKTVELTSRPERRGANQMYRSMGFRQRQTNVYRLVL